MISTRFDREIGRDEASEREDRRVVADEEWRQEFPDPRVWFRGVNVTTPDPAAVSSVVQLAERQGLRVVDDDQVVRLVELLRVVCRLREIPLLVVRTQSLRRALEAIVNRLRDTEEGVVAADELPVGHQSEIAEEWDLGAENLGDAASVGRRAHVQYPSAAQGTGQLAQLGDHVAGARFIPVDRL